MYKDEMTLCVVDASVIGTVVGPTGWAAWIGNDDDHEIFSGHSHTLMGNNTAECLAILQGLRRCEFRSRVLLWTDSREAYQWLHGKPVYKPAIRHLIEAIHDAVHALELLVTYQQVKGHKDNRLHNIVHDAAYKQAKIAEREWYQ